MRLKPLLRWLGVLFATALLPIASLSLAGSVDDLLKNVQSEDSEVRVEAADKAAEAGPEALIPLAKLLDLDNEFITKDVKQAMQNIVHHAGRPEADAERKACAEALEKLLADGNTPVVVNEACRLLQFAGTGEQVPAVAKHLKDKEVREEACAALEEIPGKEATKALVDALGQVPEDFKPRVLDAIARHGDPSAAEALAEVYKKASPDLKIDTLDAMIQLRELPTRGKKGEFRLGIPVQALASERNIARLADILLQAADLLRKEGKKDQAAKLYQDLLEGAVHEHIASGALVGLGKIGDQKQLSLFGDYLSNESVAIRGVASKIVSEWPGKEVDRVLKNRFEKAEGAERTALLKVLVARDVEGLDSLLKASLSDPDSSVRLLAFEILGERGGPDMEATFLEASSDPDGAVASAAKTAYLNLAYRILSDGDEKKALAMYHTALDFQGDTAAVGAALNGVAGLGKEESIPKVQAMLETPHLAQNAARAYLALADAVAEGGDKDRQLAMITEIVHHPNAGDVKNAALRKMKDLGHDTGVFTKRKGFINAWHTIGPFPNDGGSGAFGVPYFPEKAVDLEKGGEFEGEKLSWTQVSTDEIPAKISLSSAFSKNQFVTAYAFVELDAPKEMPVQFLNGTNDGCEFWVNGEKLFEYNGERGCEVDGDKIPTTLKQGKNEVLLKVLQSAGGWEFCVRLADKDGNPIDLTKTDLFK